MNKAYKYRLYPNKEQSILLDKHFGVCRFIYNLALETKNYAYSSHRINLSGFDLMNQIPELKKENPWLKEVNAQSLQQSISDMDKAFNLFFKGHNSFPRFKKKSGKQSFRSQAANGISIEEGKLYQPKFLEGIKVVIDRAHKGTIKNTTISKAPTGKYWVSVLCETGEIKPELKPIKEETAVGIDLGLKSYIATSNGLKIDAPKYLKQSIERLKVLQRRNRNKKKGSNKWKKANKQIALVHEKIAFQRKDFIHKLSKQLVNNHDTLCFETLQVQNMVKNHNLAGAIQDAGWSMFVDFCTYKADWSGKNILQIPTFEPSSKMCSCCGTIKKDLTLADREWTCEICHTKHDRDENAALNIKAFALRKYIVSDFVKGKTAKKHSRRATPGVPLEMPTLVGSVKRENVRV